MPNNRKVLIDSMIYFILCLYNIFQTKEKKNKYIQLHKNKLHNFMVWVVVWLTNENWLASFPAETIARDLHHHESPTPSDKGLNLRRTSVQA